MAHLKSRMKKFEVDLNIESGKSKFCFSPIALSENTKYFVEVKKADQTAVYFEMVKKKNEGWHIVPPVPLWIQNLEELLTKAIFEYN